MNIHIISGIMSQNTLRFAFNVLRDFEIGGSFNGRTTDSDSVNRGSTPFPPAINKNGVGSFRPAPFLLLKNIDILNNSGGV